MRGKPHPNQEVSAFVEAGVFYVKTLADMASKPNASVAVQTDWVVIQSWLGRRDRPSPLRSWIGFAWAGRSTSHGASPLR